MASMPPSSASPAARRTAFAIAAILSLPAVALSAWAAVYVSHSIATQPWYRDTFLRYGIERGVLDIVFIAGVAAAALLATGLASSKGRWLRMLAWALVAAGVATALGSESEFWPDADPLVPRGTFILPFVAWAIAAAFSRRRVA